MYPPLFGNNSRTDSRSVLKNCKCVTISKLIFSRMHRAFPEDFNTLYDETMTYIIRFNAAEVDINRLLCNIISLSGNASNDTILHRTLTQVNCEFLLNKRFIENCMKYPWENQIQFRHMLIYINAIIDSFFFKLKLVNGLRRAFTENAL